MNQEIEPFELNFSKDVETEGFDLQAGQTWIYPTNYPIREYQYNIVQQALLKNTLVSLPTGLGKTFIAAVVMYNFFRWYPLGKIIFMAPTRPLVRQQIEACYDIMGIPKDVTAEITGTKISTSRENIWKEKRVFFITPQILQNDLEKVAELSQKIKCLVFDEAHRAKGNHSYCEVIRKLAPYNKYFRVLALSATPGNSIGDVLEVVRNLSISHLEFRTEENADVKPYVFERNLTTVVVPLGDKLQEVRDNYLQVLEYYTKTLIQHKVIHGNCANLTKGKIFMTLKEFQQKNNSTSSANYGEIMKSLNICITLYHGFELLVRHGLRSFLSFFDEHIDKPLLRGSAYLREILNDVREYLGPEPVIEQLPDGSFVEIPDNSKFGHPKFYKLRDILVSHFLQENDSSRVIVFFEYRNSVMEAYALLNQGRPLLKPRIFLGQGGGVTQRQQLKVIESFKEGQCNILLSTCIGEEGLDVGDVDLIVCFDISNKSPIRMVQRMGRTGRKKEGRVTVLVTEGKEQQILKDCLVHKNNITVHVLSSKELARGLNTESPRLVPPDIVPKCNKIYVTVKKPVLTKKSSIKDMFRNVSNRSSEPFFSPDLEIVEIGERIPPPTTLWDKGNPLDANFLIPNVFSKKIEKQRALQPIHRIKHTPNSELLVDLLQHVDSKRFNIPITQMGYSSQSTQNRHWIQSDIRSMFTKSQSSSDFLPKTQAQKVPIIRTVSQEDASTRDTKELLSELSNFLTIQNLDTKTKCKHCPDNFDCNSHNINSLPDKITLIQPDESVFKSITLEDINLFFEVHVLKTKKNEVKCTVDSNLKSPIQCDPGKYKSATPPSEEVEFFDSPPLAEKTCTYQAPKTLDSLLNRYSTSILDEEEFLREPHKAGKKPSTENITPDQDIVEFFLLKSLEELFGGTKINDSDETIIYSPDIIENSLIRDTDGVGLNQEMQYKLSPVLCSSQRVRNIRQFQRNLFKENYTDTSESSVNVKRNVKSIKPNLKKLRLHKSSEVCKAIESPSRFTTDAVKSSSTPVCKGIQKINSTESVSQLENVIEDNQEWQGFKSNHFNNCGVEKKRQDKIDIDDLCDLSAFGLQTTRTLQTFDEPQHNINNASTTRSTENNLCIDEICDLSMFGIVNPVNKQMAHRSEAEVFSVEERRSVNKEINSTEGKILSSIDYQKRNRRAPSPSQVTITQMIDLINTNEEGSTSQKENFVRPHIPVKKYDGEFSPMKKAVNNERSIGTNRFQNSNKQSNGGFGDTLDNTFCDVPFSLRTNKVNRQPKSLDNQRPKPNYKKKKKSNPFIEDEAELSSDENLDISEDEEDEEQSIYDTSFVDDCSQKMDTQMHIKYLQSTRSPRNGTKFKIPQKPKFNITNVYSQEVHREDDTYLDDSFVVHDEVEDEHHEKSELEILEEKLRKIKKKKRHKSDDVEMPAKRKRIVQLSSDESD